MVLHYLYSESDESMMVKAIRILINASETSERLCTYSVHLCPKYVLLIYATHTLVIPLVSPVLNFRRKKIIDKYRPNHAHSTVLTMNRMAINYQASFSSYSEDLPNKIEIS